MKYSAVAVWKGSKQEGEGVTTSNSKLLNNIPYTFMGRSEEKATTPAELIATAHADCFTLMLTALLDKHKLVPSYIEAKAEVTVDKDFPAITHSHLSVRAKIPHVTKEQFAEIAITASQTCPVSRLLKAEISIDYELIE